MRTVEKKKLKDTSVPLGPGEHRPFTFGKADLPELFPPQVRPKGTYANRAINTCPSPSQAIVTSAALKFCCGTRSEPRA